MMEKGATSHSRGHKIYYNELYEEWRYCDDDTPITKERPCVGCGHLPTVEGYDYCLGYLPSVKSACCGHGVSEPYYMGLDGERHILRGRIIDKE